MYAALWRVLPGPWWVRVVILLVLLVAVLAALAFWVFPWVEGFISTPEVTVSE
jgi:ABC-type transporter Mla subunit MlaD